MPGRLYASGSLEPIQDLYKTILLVDQRGPFKGRASAGGASSPFFRVTGIEPVIGLGAHGLTILWSHAGAPPAGYGAPAGTHPRGPAAGAIPANQTLKVA